MKPNDLSQVHLLTLMLKVMVKIPGLKLEIMREHQNIKIFLQKNTNQIGQKKFLWIKRLKILYHGQM